jgi:exosortase A-associated hydrolase 1
MRRLLTIDCGGAALGASLDTAAGRTGLLIVTGGTQTRIGSHRLFERLGFALAGAGYPCFRYDRRGVGDSEGADPGWRGSRDDIEAALGAFRREASLDHLVGFGLCDGASALALHAGGLAIDGLILVNPWLVEAEAGEPPAAAVKDHYRQQLTSVDGWKKILSGSVSYSKLLKGIRRIIAPPPATLADELARSLAAAAIPVELILARGDATAIAALAEWQSLRFAASRRVAPAFIESDSHTFARPGDFEALLAACHAALDRLTVASASGEARPAQPRSEASTR